MLPTSSSEHLLPFRFPGLFYVIRFISSRNTNDPENLVGMLSPTSFPALFVNSPLRRGLKLRLRDYPGYEVVLPLFERNVSVPDQVRTLSQVGTSSNMAYAM